MPPSEPNRPTEQPRYHLTALPQEGVCCPYDPNGAIYWNGRYHLMYIYQDPQLPHGGHCWGHASSADLVNWTFHPPALVPGPGDADVGIFSGNAFVNREGVPMLCWFGVEAGVCIATAEDDDLLRWKKHPGNPVIPMPKPGEPGHGTYTVWDPYLWLEGDMYHCLLGGNRLPDGKDTLYLCKSPDLVQWTLVGPFYEHSNADWTEADEDCSCPDFFRLGDRHVLLCISHKIGARCYVGRYKEEHFYPEQHVRMNWPGGMCFAPESLVDPQGRRICWFWITDPRVRPARTVSGVQSLPRILSSGPDGGLEIRPAPELQALRCDRHAIPPVTLVPDHDRWLDSVEGDCLEMELEMELREARQVGMKVRCSRDGREETALWYDVEREVLRLDMSRTTLRTDIAYGQPPFSSYSLERAEDSPRRFTQFEAPLAMQPGEPLRLRLFLDGPVLEVYANDRQCLTQQIFPSLMGSTGVQVCARGGVAIMQQGTAWQMANAEFEDQTERR